MFNVGDLVKVTDQLNGYNMTDIFFQTNIDALYLKDNFKIGKLPNETSIYEVKFYGDIQAGWDRAYAIEDVKTHQVYIMSDNGLKIYGISIRNNEIKTTYEQAFNLIKIELKYNKDMFSLYQKTNMDNSEKTSYLNQIKYIEKLEEYIRVIEETM